MAIAVYRQPPNDPYDLALALAHVAHDETTRQRLTKVSVNAGILQNALPWERQVGSVTHVQLDAKTRILLRAEALRARAYL